MLLAAYLAQPGLGAEAARVEASLRGAPPKVPAEAREALLETEDPLVWEVTDRQRNLDWGEPARRPGVAENLDRLPSRT